MRRLGSAPLVSRCKARWGGVAAGCLGTDAGFVDSVSGSLCVRDGAKNGTSVGACLRPRPKHAGAQPRLHRMGRRGDSRQQRRHPGDRSGSRPSAVPCAAGWPRAYIGARACAGRRTQFVMPRNTRLRGGNSSSGRQRVLAPAELQCSPAAADDVARGSASGRHPGRYLPRERNGRQRKRLAAGRAVRSREGLREVPAR